MKEIASKHLEQFCTSTEANSEYRKSVTTIHSVKGASIGAVLLFLSDNDRGQNISLNDFPDSHPDIMTEKQRMIYVACSRAQDFLALVAPSTVSDTEINTKLREMDYEIQKPEIQQELF